MGPSLIPLQTCFGEKASPRAWWCLWHFLEPRSMVWPRAASLLLPRGPAAGLPASRPSGAGSEEMVCLPPKPPSHLVLPWAALGLQQPPAALCPHLAAFSLRLCLCQGGHPRVLHLMDLRSVSNEDCCIQPLWLVAVRKSSNCILLSYHLPLFNQRPVGELPWPEPILGAVEDRAKFRLPAKVES